MGIVITDAPQESLFILPFDHRGSLQKMLFEHKNPLTDEESETVKKYKKVIFGAIKKVGEERGGFDDLAILVDEEFGYDIHMEAKELGLRNALTTEKSGQPMYDFQYDDWGDHIIKIGPTFAKALIRVVIGEDNSVQNSRLKELGDFCEANGVKFLLEPLVQPSEADLEAVGGDKKKFDMEVRPVKFAEAVKELHAAGVTPDVWKIEGTETKELMDVCSDAVMEGGKPNPQIVILGRGESAEKVAHWLTVGAKSAGVTGFAVGRTIFAEAIMKLHKGEASEEEATNEIAENYKHFISVFEEARG
jgi:5-dehydro-2-deoxygluconokinase